MTDVPDILIIDDDRAIGDLISEVLSDEGYAVRVAHDAAQAVAAINARTPGLLLMDIRMPGVDGATLLSVLQDNGLSAAPVVLMSADRQLLHSITEGVTGYLEKPFELDVLLACVLRYHSTPAPAGA